jgi:hypothetical protein
MTREVQQWYCSCGYATAAPSWDENSPRSTSANLIYPKFQFELQKTILLFMVRTSEGTEFRTCAAGVSGGACRGSSLSPGGLNASWALESEASDMKLFFDGRSRPLFRNRLMGLRECCVPRNRGQLTCRRTVRKWYQFRERGSRGQQNE